MQAATVVGMHFRNVQTYDKAFKAWRDRTGDDPYQPPKKRGRKAEYVYTAPNPEIVAHVRAHVFTCNNKNEPCSVPKIRKHLLTWGWRSRPRASRYAQSCA